MSPEHIATAGNTEASCIAVLEKLGFVVVCETNGGMEEWVALRDDLHLRAESPRQLLGLYSVREHRGASWAPADEEVEALSIRLGMSENAFRRTYTRREGDRRTLIEKPNNDCIFYQEGVGCTVYEQRPKQCRTWPFWESNLKSERHWRKTVEICPGSGEGRLYTIEEIIEKKETIRI